MKNYLFTSGKSYKNPKSYLQGRLATKDIDRCLVTYKFFKSYLQSGPTTKDTNECLVIYKKFQVLPTR